jgi:guanylate kinase
MKSQHKSHLFVISGPSGVGKNTIINALMKRVEGLAYSVSHTTRKPRNGEVNGRDYYFVDEETFKKMIEDGYFVEWAKVYSDYYGTSFSGIKEKLSEGKDVILDLDVQGAMNLKASFKNSTLIFVIPPSVEELKRRLKKRGMNQELIQKRLSNIECELKMAEKYDYIVLNDELEKAVKETEAIILAERCRTSKRIELLRSLI